jgi:hypothetical protein
MYSRSRSTKAGPKEEKNAAPPENRVLVIHPVVSLFTDR